MLIPQSFDNEDLSVSALYENIYCRSIESDSMSNRLLLAIGSRLSRQKEAPSSISISSRIYIEDDRRSARAFYSIMKVNPASVNSLAVDTAVRENWELVARGMKLQPGAVNHVVTTKAALGLAVRTRSSEAKRDTIKDVWDVRSGGFTIWSKKIMGPIIVDARGNNHCEHVEKSQAGWTRLEQILDMSHNEFAKI